MSDETPRAESSTHPAAICRADVDGRACGDPAVGYVVVDPATGSAIRRAAVDWTGATAYGLARLCADHLEGARQADLMAAVEDDPPSFVLFDPRGGAQEPSA